MMKENKLTFQPFARIKFVIDPQEDPEYRYIEVSCGHELFESLQLYYEGKYEELFGFVVFEIWIEGIEYYAKTDGIDFSLKIGTDDVAQAELTFDKKSLHDENAKKIKMIRDIVNYDDETEDYLLRDWYKSK